MFLRVATVAALLFAPLYAQAPAKAVPSAALPNARDIINKHIMPWRPRCDPRAHVDATAPAPCRFPRRG